MGVAGGPARRAKGNFKLQPAEFGREGGASAFGALRGSMGRLEDEILVVG